MSRQRTRAAVADPNPVACGKIKGIAFLGVVKLLRSRRDEALALLRPELHRYLTETVSASAWYPESEHAELLHAGAQLYDVPPDRALEVMGELAAQSHSEIYHELILGRGSQSRAWALWSSQHDSGELRRVRETSTRMSFELVDFAGPSREFCLTFTGYLRGTFTVNGFTEVAVEKLACKLWSDSSCLWRCSWKREPRADAG